MCCIAWLDARLGIEKTCQGDNFPCAVAGIDFAAGEEHFAKVWKLLELCDWILHFTLFFEFYVLIQCYLHNKKIITHNSTMKMLSKRPKIWTSSYQYMPERRMIEQQHAGIV